MNIKQNTRASKEVREIIKVVKDFLKVDVFYAYQDRIRPCGDYVSIYLIDEKQIGQAESKISEDGTLNTIRKQFSIRICFNCISENPFKMANDLSMMFELSTVRNVLREKGISWHKSYSIRNTTTILDKNHQQRLRFEASFYINKTLEEKISFIEKVKINGFN